MKTILALWLSATLAALAAGPFTLAARSAGAWTPQDTQTWETEFGSMPSKKLATLQAVEVMVRSSAPDDATAYIEIAWLPDGQKAKAGQPPTISYHTVLEIRVQPGQERRIKVPVVLTRAGSKYKMGTPGYYRCEGDKLVWVLRMFDPATGKQLGAAASRPPLVAVMNGVALPTLRATP